MVTKYPENGVFFTSDTHFSHKKILDFCHRPFGSIEEHDDVLINNWNSVIGPDDTVFHLGDFAFGGFPVWEKIVKQLNGHIILIRGNHCDQNMTAGVKSLFEDCLYQARILIGNQTVYLNHYPFLCFAHQDPSHYKDYFIQLFGHVHSGPLSEGTDISRLKYCFPTQYDVGVDNNNYTPISWLQVKEKINQQVLNYLNKDEIN